MRLCDDGVYYLSWEDYLPFYQNEYIRSIAPLNAWTISDENKRPIDMHEYRSKRHICGCGSTQSPSLTDLNTVCQTIPCAANHAYYMDALRDKYVVLDIEPICPDDIKSQLLQLPYVYGEYSMSGKGYHLVLPLPDCFQEYPIAQTKVKMQEEHKYYEILLNHFVTFTRNMLPPATGHSDFEPIFRELCAQQKEVHREQIDIESIAPDGIPAQAMLLNTLMGCKYRKTPESFFGDMSKYEYGHIGFLRFKLDKMLNTITIRNNGHQYTDNEIAWLLYQVALEQIPYRPKHDESRDGLPWLLYLCREIIAKNGHTKKEKEPDE